jgi:glycosyltransferase involved in cell wall biosynthesis
MLAASTLPVVQALNLGTQQLQKIRIGFDARMVYYRQAGIGQYILNLLRELASLPTSNPQTTPFELVVLQSRKEKHTPNTWLFEKSSGSTYPETTNTPQPAPPLLASRQIWTPPHHRLEQLVLPLEAGLARLDVLHSPDFIPPLQRWRWSKMRPQHFSSVITIHDLAFLKFPHLLTAESARYYGQIQQAARSAERIIAVSQATAHDIESQLGIDPTKIKVVYEAANPLFKPLEPPALDELGRNKLPQLLAKLEAGGLVNSANFILFVSTIEPRKNLPVLLKAFRALLDKMATQPEKTESESESESEKTPKLVVAGREGWLFEDIFKLAQELGLRPNHEIIWLGGVSTEELLWLYNKASCLALPSLYEGFGLPPLEALACGTPVLVANTSSLPEVVGDVGQLIEPDDVAAWCAALEQVWQTRQEQRARVKLTGPAWAKRFSWQRAAQETLGVYSEAYKLI